ncbi:MAG: GTPase Era [Polyangiaceae bacterium]
MVDSETIERSGTVAILGRSNVGKSTLLNAALSMPLAIVSNKPQTTRQAFLGVVRHAGAEIILLDTPGLHRAQDRLGKEMNRAARSAAKSADVIVFVTALPERPRPGLAPHRGDLELLGQLDPEIPVVMVINKVDLAKDKKVLLPLMSALGEVRSFAAIVPISARRDEGVRLVLDEVAKLLPEGPAQFDEDTLTDRPLRWFVTEFVREPILAATSQEVPHAIAVTVERYDDGGEVVSIHATIHVERDGQKRIIIGDKGALIKRVGIKARQRIEELLERRVHLELFVRVTKDWRQRPQDLADFGLIAGSEPS